MIYRLPPVDEPVDQGDLVEKCPVAFVAGFHRRSRIQVPYREHLARHFAETYARIGLPEPYVTE